ncbi:hypothetical protein GF339_03030 [candidate division KSB3 bacterium]|uniref:Uncharacterized protein n=1 Tax=candidate division KSB3 bacterium TaxID=2044937 RepID=A0A9D5JSN5_9BACT|nr:hypothetical protein [candidate division KSB3 bacterium]MBD3323529.1 hypothetical protein [candidate division KSB3 bacterium]
MGSAILRSLLVKHPLAERRQRVCQGINAVGGIFLVVRGALARALPTKPDGETFPKEGFLKIDDEIAVDRDESFEIALNIEE